MPTRRCLYYFPSNDVLKDFGVRGGRLTGPVARGTNKIIDPGATPSISANGTRDAIVWALGTKGWQDLDRHATLFAYDAQNVANKIYDSEQNAARDRPGMARRFVSPVVVDGRLYRATSGEINVYGLLSMTNPYRAEALKAVM